MNNNNIKLYLDFLLFLLINDRVNKKKLKNVKNCINYF